MASSAATFSGELGRAPGGLVPWQEAHLGIVVQLERDLGRHQRSVIDYASHDLVVVALNIHLSEEQGRFLRIDAFQYRRPGHEDLARSGDVEPMHAL